MIGGVFAQNEWAWRAGISIYVMQIWGATE